jgi:hypothetical protein
MGTDGDSVGFGILGQVDGMKVTIVFKPSESLDYRFEVEGADWTTIFKEVQDISDKFDKAHEEVFGKRTLVDRVMNR